MPVNPLLKEIRQDVSRLLDCSDEAQNNAERNEFALLHVNLKGCISLAGRIQRLARVAKKELAALERSAAR